MKLTILMPVLNEELTLKKSIELSKKYIRKTKIDAEILIVDNGSTDNSIQIAKLEKVHIVYEPHQGYGNALRRGIKEAKGKYIIMGDADATYDFSDLTPMVQLLDDGYDLVMGNRFLGHREKGAMSLTHFIGIKFLTSVANHRFHTHLGDYHSGLRGFKSTLAKSMPFTCEGMNFATELVYEFKRLNYRITEVPINLSCPPKERKSHLRTFHDGYEHLKYICQMPKINR